MRRHSLLLQQEKIYRKSVSPFCKDYRIFLRSLNKNYEVIMVHMDKCSKCIRWTLFAFNCLLWLGGSTMLGLGIWVTTQDTEYKHLGGNLYVTIGYIILSSFIFIIGFLGACGILMMKQNVLRVYFALMLLLLMLELGVAIYLYIEKDKIQDHVGTNWNETSDEARIVIQQEFRCCGLKPLNLEHKSSSDKSCFVDNDKTKERLKDCYTHLMDWIKANHIILASCSAAVAALQMFILGGTCRLITEIESGDRSVKRTRVVPLNIKEDHQRQEITQQKTTGQMPANATPAHWKAGTSKLEPPEHSDEFEERNKPNVAARRNWAKVNPKYNSILSLIEK